MRRVVAALAGLLALAAGAPSRSGPAGSSRPPARASLPQTERLTFAIEFGIIRAGSATLEIRPSGRAAPRAPLVEIVSRARSSPFFSHFYPVDDEIRSVVDPVTLLPVRFEKRLSEGSYHARESIVFDRDAGRVRYAEGDTVRVPPGARDALSAVYDLRRMRPLPGDSITFVHHTARKTTEIAVRVLGRETLATRVGRFRCLKTEPVLASGGLFKHEGQLWVWFTDDERMIPVRMESKLTFGSIVAEIERIERPDFRAEPGGRRRERQHDAS